MIHVCAAIIRENGKTLVSDRPKLKKWEFPGGKCETGESVYECIRREMMEELALPVIPLDIVFDYSYSYPDKDVYLTFIRCLRCSGAEPCAREGQHFRWISTRDLCSLDFLEADKRIAELLSSSADSGKALV